MNNRPLSTQSQTIILKCFDQPLNEAELKQLAELLRSDAAARKYYLDAVQLHSDLTTHNETVQLAKRIFTEFPNPDCEGEVTEEPQSQLLSVIPISDKPARALRFLNAIKLPYAALVLASGMFLGCGIGIVAASAIYERISFAPFQWTRVVQQDVAARVNATYSCEWQSSESPETLPTRSLRPGQQIRLQEGLLQLVFRNGQSVLLEGPAVFEVRSENAGKLYTGKMSITAPQSESAFVIETQQGAMQLNDGRFGIASHEDGTTTYASFVGGAQIELWERGTGQWNSSEQLLTGGAVRVGVDGTLDRLQVVELESFVHDMPSGESEAFEGDTVLLGNLFDDSTSSSLTTAMKSDTYQAAGETTDLGVAAVRDGGLDVDFPLVDGGVHFNFVNIGGNGQRVRGLPSNDTFRSVSSDPIRTTGQTQSHIEAPEYKVEDGVGMSANELITFDLEEIRAAGQLEGKTLRFLSDRAGINDYEQDSIFPGDARFVVIVSNETEVLEGYVNGQKVDVEQHAGVFRFEVSKDHQLRWLKRDGVFAKFEVDLPLQARFLTLATLSGFDPHHDHAVFSGARLEILRDADPEGISSASSQH